MPTRSKMYTVNNVWNKAKESKKQGSIERLIVDKNREEKRKKRK